MARLNTSTRGEIVTEGLQLGGAPGLTDRAEIYLNLWLDELYAAYDWPFLLKEEAVTITGSTFDLSTLSNTFRSLKAIRLDNSAYDLQEWKPGFVDLRRRIIEAAENSSTAKPEYMFVDPDASNDQVYVYPTPDQSYAGDLWYFYQPAEIATGTGGDSSVPVLPSAMLMVNAVASFAAKFDGSNMQGILMQDVKNAVAMLRANMRSNDHTQDVVPFDPAYHNWKAPK